MERGAPKTMMTLAETYVSGDATGILIFVLVALLIVYVATRF